MRGAALAPRLDRGRSKSSSAGSSQLDLAWRRSVRVSMGKDSLWRAGRQAPCGKRLSNPGPGAATPVAQTAHSADLTIAASRPLGKAHGLLRRLEQSAGFIVALLLFRRGIAVGDNSGA